MQRFRIYLISIIGGVVGAITVLAISARMESRHAAELLARMRNVPTPPAPPDFQGGYVWGSDFGPGLITWYLVVMVFAAVFYLLLRWQRRSLE